MAKGGKPDEGCKTSARARNSLWPLDKGGNHRQAVEAGRWGRRTGGWLLHAQESWGGGAGATRERSRINMWKTGEIDE